MSEIERRIAEIQAANELIRERQRYILDCHDLARYVLPNLASRAAERDGKRALEALRACQKALEQIASGR